MRNKEMILSERFRQMIEDFKATKDFWGWARKQNKLTSKLDWPGYERICSLRGVVLFVSILRGARIVF